ncbi:hypothetical protein ACHHYP_04311 [Achlya hypogyna]|uniref:Uncharacterized protein n=1 Tax=Achlya hypogyna TaxID=1202772 RepID=A0A1V9Z1F3_ACHHY|nr:hypothetical protein ACHHYP_04311 [Achlya hypogyna]
MGEVYRLKSNHTELLMHERTLQRQLDIKKDQLRELQRAIAACNVVLDNDTKQTIGTKDAPHT